MDEPCRSQVLPVRQLLNDAALISVEPEMESEPQESVWILIGIIAGLIATLASGGLLGWLAFGLAAELLG